MANPEDIEVTKPWNCHNHDPEMSLGGKLQGATRVRVVATSLAKTSRYLDTSIECMSIRGRDGSQVESPGILQAASFNIRVYPLAGDIPEMVYLESAIAATCEQSGCVWHSMRRA